MLTSTESYEVLCERTFGASAYAHNTKKENTLFHMQEKRNLYQALK